MYIIQIRCRKSRTEGRRDVSYIYSAFQTEVFISDVRSHILFHLSFVISIKYSRYVLAPQIKCGVVFLDYFITFLLADFT